MNIKIFFFSLLAALVLAMAGVFIAYKHFGIHPQSVLIYLFGPRYMEVTEFSTGGAGYSCTKPIKVQKWSGSVLHMFGTNWETHYVPSDEKEAELFCSISWIE